MKTLDYDIEEVIKLFERKDVLDLRGLSSRLIREAAMQNDYAKAELGVIAYALHKIETKPHFVKDPKWGKVRQTILIHLNDAKNSAKNNQQKLFFDALKSIILSIRGIDNEIGNYAENIYEKSKVKEASLAYSYGLSIAQSAELTGADVKEVQSYVGFTTMHDEEPEAKNIAQRVKELRSLVEA